jgi:integrase
MCPRARAPRCGSLINPKKLAKEVAEHLREPERRAEPPPTLDEFVPRFLSEHAKANRHKPRGIDAKETIFRLHLLPRFAGLRLDEFTAAHVQALKSGLDGKSAKTVNNVLTVLNKTLRTAVRWRVLQEMPVTVDFLKHDLDEVGFYDFQQYARLRAEAARLDPRVLVTVLLGGDAGLRRGEMIALSPLDVNLSQNYLTIRHSDVNGALTSTKGGKHRIVPMTKRLRRAIAPLVKKEERRVLVRDDGDPLSIQTIRTWIGWAQRASGLIETGRLHVLRHTFCSHLAMRGATPLAIKELAGHKSLRTTMRYMHLAPNERARAIALLEVRRSGIQPNNQGRQ